MLREIFQATQPNDVEAAQRRLMVAQALQQRSMHGNVPAPGGQVQAAYTPGNALIDLATSLTSAYGVKKAEAAYTRAKDAKSQALSEAIKGYQKSTPDADVGAQSLQNLRNAPEGQLPDVVTPRSEASASLMKEVGDGGQEQLAQALLSRDMAPPKAPIAVAAGSSLYDPSTNKAIYTAPKEEKSDHFAEAEAGRNARAAASISARPTNQPASEDNVDAAAKAISGYQQAPLGAYAMRTPYGQSVMARVMELNPEYQANEYGSRAKAYKEFTTGKNGNQVRSFNVAISHLSTLANMADTMGNGDIPTLNKIKNEFARATGKAAPNTFDGVKKIVTDEIVKSIVGAGGGVADREEAANTIASASSPAQLTGIINGYRELMAGQLGGLQLQYEQSTGRRDFDRLLSTESKAYLEQHAGAAPPAKSDAGPQGGPKQIKTDADYDALPKGAEFIAPDGSHRRKP